MLTPPSGGEVTAAEYFAKHPGELGGGNKFHARRTWSETCNRFFASKGEAMRGEELAILEKASVIGKLTYQPMWVLSEEPRVTYKADFGYSRREPHDRSYVVEDVKGVLTRDTRTKLAWLKQRYGITVSVVPSPTHERRGRRE